MLPWTTVNTAEGNDGWLDCPVAVQFVTCTLNGNSTWFSSNIRKNVHSRGSAFNRNFSTTQQFPNKDFRQVLSVTSINRWNNYKFLYSIQLDRSITNRRLYKCWSILNDLRFRIQRNYRCTHFFWNCQFFQLELLQI